jgi:hypothetical protein
LARRPATQVRILGRNDLYTFGCDTPCAVSIDDDDDDDDDDEDDDDQDDDDDDDDLSMWGPCYRG